MKLNRLKKFGLWSFCIYIFFDHLLRAISAASPVLLIQSAKKKTPKKKQAFQKTILNRNLITGCFLSRCNPIMCNLLLPNALTRGRARAHSPAFQVPVLEVNYIPSISRSRSRASGSLRSLLWLSESSLRPGDKGESVGGP